MKRTIALVLAIMMVMSCMASITFVSAATPANMDKADAAPTTSKLVESEWPAFSNFSGNEARKFSLMWDENNLYVAVRSDLTEVPQGAWGSGMFMIALSDRSVNPFNAATGAHDSRMIWFGEASTESYIQQPARELAGSSVLPYTGNENKYVLNVVTNEDGKYDFIATIDWDYLGLEGKNGQPIYFGTLIGGAAGGTSYGSRVYEASHPYILNDGTYVAPEPTPEPTPEPEPEPDKGLKFTEAAPATDEIITSEWPGFVSFKNDPNKKFSLMWDEDNLYVAVRSTLTEIKNGSWGANMFGLMFSDRARNPFTSVASTYDSRMIFFGEASTESYIAQPAPRELAGMDVLLYAGNEDKYVLNVVKNAEGKFDFIATIAWDYLGREAKNGEEIWFGTFIDSASAVNTSYGWGAYMTDHQYFLEGGPVVTEETEETPDVPEYITPEETDKDLHYAATAPTLGNIINKTEWPSFTPFGNNTNRNSASWSMMWDKDYLYVAIDTDDKVMTPGGWGSGDTILVMLNPVYGRNINIQSGYDKSLNNYAARLMFVKSSGGQWIMDSTRCNNSNGDSVGTFDYSNVTPINATDENGDIQFMAKIAWSAFNFEEGYVGDGMDLNFGFMYTFFDGSWEGGSTGNSAYQTPQQLMLNGSGYKTTYVKPIKVLPATPEAASSEIGDDRFCYVPSFEINENGIDYAKWPAFKPFTLNGAGESRNFYSYSWNDEGINIALITSDRTVSKFKDAADVASNWWKTPGDSIFMMIDPLAEGGYTGPVGYGEGTMHAARINLCRTGEDAWASQLGGDKNNGSEVMPGAIPADMYEIKSTKRADGNWEYQITIKWEFFGITELPSVLNGDKCGITIMYVDPAESGAIYSNGDKGLELAANPGYAFKYADLNDYLTVTVESQGAGRVAPKGAQLVVAGTDYSVRVNPDDGYMVYKLLVDGVETTFEGNTFTLTNVQENHTIKVIFEEEGYVPPVDEPTQEPTDEPTQEPTDEPTQEPTDEEIDFNCSDNIGSGSIDGNVINLGVAEGTTVELEITLGDKALQLYADPGLTKEIGRLINMSEQVIKVYAKDGDEVYTVVLSKEATEYDFADLKEDAWYLDYVDLATTLGIIKGSVVDGKTLLKPEDKATRIEGIIFALRMLGIDTTAFADVELAFADYDENDAAVAWSANYVKAAVALGLMKGSEVDGKLYLNGNNSISRQEFFAIFARAMQITDKDESYKATDLSKFVDADKIATWFVDNIKYLVNAKIVEGNPVEGGYTINPTGDILRCEIIKMVTAALTE